MEQRQRQWVEFAPRVAPQAMPQELLATTTKRVTGEGQTRFRHQLAGGYALREMNPQSKPEQGTM